MPESRTKKKLLIVEDEPDIRRGLKDALEAEGFHVATASTAAEGMALAKQPFADCIVLDLMLPDGSGYEVCEAVRKFSLVPIIMLTAKSQESDKVMGLEAGADDYVTKPFSVRELVARIHAIFRRLARQETSVRTLTIGDAAVDLTKQVLTKGRQSHVLTFYEVELLRLLAERAEQPVSREEILEKIWGVVANPNNRTVDNFIVKLRRKIEKSHKNPRHILTVYGHGYKLVP